MSTVFGEVAALYDEVRPGYPDEVADLIADYAAPTSAAEIGAGTGHGTKVLVRLGIPLTCVEPDERMAAVLAQRFPRVKVVIGKFEEWTPPPGGVPLLACALAWHWIDSQTRRGRALDALAPGGTLAIFGNHYGFVDPAQLATLDVAFADPVKLDHRPGLARDEIAASGLFKRVTSTVITTEFGLPTERYLRLVQTFSPFRRRDPVEQGALLDRLRTAIDGFGGQVEMRLETTLCLATRPPSAASASAVC